MTKRNAWVSAAVALLVVIAIGVWWSTKSPATPSSHQITIPLESDIQTLDPAALSDPTTTRIVWQIYEGLVGLDAENNVVPVLAESWESRETGRTWIFHLRKGVRFHQHSAFDADPDSRTVTAADVIWSIKRLAKGFGSFVFGGIIEGFDDYVAGSADEISGLSSPSPAELQITLVHPDPSFVYRITSPYLSIMSRKVTGGSFGASKQSVTIGTGPFRLAQATSTEVVLERNRDYWRPTAGNLERVTFRVEKNPQFRITGLKSGNYDMLRLPTEFRREFVDHDALKSEWSSKFTLEQFQTYNVHLLAMDVNQLSDEYLRRAISYAIDRKPIVNELLSGGSVAANGPVPPGMQGYHSQLSVEFNRDHAKRELAKSSYDDQTLTLLVADVSNHPDVAQVVQADLLYCGIRTQIEQLDFNGFITRLFGKNRPALFMTSSDWIFSSPEILLHQFLSTAVPNPNIFGYSDPRVDNLIAQCSQTDSRPALNKLCHDIERIVAESPPAVWLYHEKHAYLLDRRLSGFAVTGNNHWLLADVRMDN